MSTIGIVLGSFHKDHVTRMLEAARSEAKARGMTIAAEVWVPGSMEKPLAAKRLLLRDDIDGVVVLGIIERGETKHGMVMGLATTNALIGLQLEFMKPVGMGILGPEIHPSQIPPRAEPYARSAVAVIDVMTKE